jgi:hypothetical protein
MDNKRSSTSPSNNLKGVAAYQTSSLFFSRPRSFQSSLLEFNFHNEIEHFKLFLKQGIIERALARLHGFPACFFIYTYISYNLT